MTPATDAPSDPVSDPASDPAPDLGSTLGSDATPGRRRSAVAADEVLDAAEHLLLDGGFDALSVRHVAEAVGVSRQVVYTHFDGMDGLLDQLHRRLSARLVEAVESVAASEVEPGSNHHVLAAAAAYRSVARRWPELYQLVFEQPVPDHVIGADAVEDGLRAFDRIIEMAGAWLTRARGGVEPKPAESVALARAIWSATHGFVVVERVGFAEPAETDELSDRAIAAMLDGWA